MKLVVLKKAHAKAIANHTAFIVHHCSFPLPLCGSAPLRETPFLFAAFARKRAQAAEIAEEMCGKRPTVSNYSRKFERFAIHIFNGNWDREFCEFQQMSPNAAKAWAAEYTRRHP